MANKPFREMTNGELVDEFLKWDDKVQTATSWGAALAQAAKWRDACEEILKERGISIGNG